MKIVEIKDFEVSKVIGKIGITSNKPTVSSLQTFMRYYRVAPIRKRLCYLTNKCKGCRTYCVCLVRECDINTYETG